MVGTEDIGKPVKNAAGRVGILREVIADWEDPAKLPSERRKAPTAFVSPEYGGREWTTSPSALSPA
ncbi:hypothetical protein QCN29_25840 [Streptomyces sp. HNM0663]|uniref:Uncharacterized protein n=1 Tax=Streptomyces chengmaiensis TaxID=3040919 RepID=A0ABT6HTU7_9ACTN|nr:hypothetical protein [Streptomyces chengmaiensis]MDH2392144.1 hypothetical protein [Streptomyces chengmaiensis]